MLARSSQLLLISFLFPLIPLHAQTNLTHDKLLLSLQDFYSSGIIDSLDLGDLPDSTAPDKLANILRLKHLSSQKSPNTARSRAAHIDSILRQLGQRTRFHDLLGSSDQVSLPAVDGFGFEEDRGSDIRLIHLFIDPICPASARQLKVLDQILASEPSKIRIVFHLIPIVNKSSSKLLIDALRQVDSEVNIIGLLRLLLEKQVEFLHLDDKDLRAYLRSILTKSEIDPRPLTETKHSIYRDKPLAEMLYVDVSPSIVVGNKLIRGYQSKEQILNLLE